jgi:hypothetical protein
MSSARESGRIERYVVPNRQDRFNLESPTTARTHGSKKAISGTLTRSAIWKIAFLEFDDDHHDHGTFEEAKEEALDYLQKIIEGCQARFDEIEQARTFEEYERG